MSIVFKCAHCRRAATQSTSAANRARRAGAPLYCDRRCAGLAKRMHKTKAQLVEEKRIYDVAYRATNLATIKAKKKAHFQRSYDPRKAAKHRKTRMPYHVEYCRRPAYRQWKAEYDRHYRAKKFGEFADVYMLLNDIRREVNGRVSDYDTRMANDTINKKQRRRRDYDRTVGNRP